MSSFIIEKGWMNVVMNLDDKVQLEMTVGDLKEIIFSTHSNILNEEGADE